jgi:HEAT repeat protein
MGEKTIQQLLVDLRSKSPSKQSKAAYRLGEIGDETVIKHIFASSFFDSEEYVVFKVIGEPSPIVKIARRVGISAIAPLINCLKSEWSGFKCLIAEDALVEVGEPAVDTLISLLNDITFQTKYHIVSALGRIGDLRAVEPLVTLFEQEPATEITDALAYIGEPALNALLSLLQSDNVKKRRYAAKAVDLFHEIHHLENDRTFASLVARLQDHDWIVKSYAITALGNLGDTRAIRELLPILEQQGFKQRTAIALEKIGTVEALEAVKAWRERRSNNG